MGELSVNRIGQDDNQVAWGENSAGKAGGKKQGAFLAQLNITQDDFAKKGYVSPPDMMEGGSVWTS